MINSEEIYRLLIAHQQEVSQWLASPFLDGNIALLQEVASGQHDDNDNDNLHDSVELAYEFVMKALHGNAWNDEVIAESFWQSELGQQMEVVRFWLNGDELITITEAAQLLRGSTEHKHIAYVSALIKRGELERYADPSEPNPQRRTRVSRMEVEQLLQK